MIECHLNTGVPLTLTADTSCNDIAMKLNRTTLNLFF